MRSFLTAIPAAFFTAWLAVFRVKPIALASLLLILATVCPGQSAFAQGTTVIPPPPPASGARQDIDPGRAFSPTTGQNMYWDCNKKTWIDSKTGEPVPGGFEGRRGSDGEVIPPPPPASGARQDIDPGRAFSPTTGQNMHWDPDQKTWKDSKTGEPIPGGFKGRRVKDDCPPPALPPKTASAVTPGGGWNGFYLGGELAKNSGSVRSTETLGATGAQTNQFNDTGDPIGGGINFGYNFRLPNSNIVIGPFASADKLNQTINHNFPGGSFLGTTTNSIVAVGAKAGVLTTPSILLYGIGSVSWLKEDLNINFVGTPYTSQSTTVRGFTLGLGGEYQPSALQNLGVPVSLFIQYQHTWWQDANLNTPAASPAFNYAFKRDDNTIKFGVNFYFP